MACAAKQLVCIMTHYLLPSSEVSPYFCLYVRPTRAVKGGTVVAVASMNCTVVKSSRKVDVLLLSVAAV